MQGKPKVKKFDKNKPIHRRFEHQATDVPSLTETAKKMGAGAVNTARGVRKAIKNTAHWMADQGNTVKPQGKPAPETPPSDNKRSVEKFRDWSNAPARHLFPNQAEASEAQKRKKKTQ